jgi:hypothetical protein
MGTPFVRAADLRDIGFPRHAASTALHPKQVRLANDRQHYTSIPQGYLPDCTPDGSARGGELILLSHGRALFG